MEYTTTEVHSEGKNKVIKILDDAKNAEIIIRKMLNEQREIVQGNPKKVSDEDIAKAVKKRMRKFIYSLATEFQNQVEPQLSGSRTL